jgi:hypothetical protein
MRLPLTIVLIALALSACSVERSIERLAPDDVKAFVAETERLVMAGDAAGLRAISTPESAAATADETVAQIKALFPPGEAPRETRWLNYAASVAATTNGTSNRIEVVRQLDFAESSAIFTQRVARTEEGLRLSGLHVTVLTAEQIAAARFTFEGKSAAHYLVFASLVGLPLFSLAAIVAVWRTPRLKRRVLWTLFCLIGVGSLQFNWATGELSTGLVTQTQAGFEFNILQVHLLSSSFLKVGLGPWVATLAFPLGAVLFWIQKARGQLRLKDQPAAR